MQRFSEVMTIPQRLSAIQCKHTPLTAAVSLHGLENNECGGRRAGHRQTSSISTITKTSKKELIIAIV